MKHSLCEYCGNELQPDDALRCYGCGARLRYTANDQTRQSEFNRDDDYLSGGGIDITTTIDQHRVFIQQPKASKK